VLLQMERKMQPADAGADDANRLLHGLPPVFCRLDRSSS
jgi:hypothetical protein